ncbi:MAG: Arabinose 5-phosphate isomerase KpsF [Flavobacterium sp. SCGC AAA160-P02]|nr:MAG: Arabinose 5-phosphate isomerase KpsF [Flavobacterium sp. SCGC AAA160-P02]
MCDRFISRTQRFFVISKPNKDKKHHRTPVMEIKKLAQEVFEIEAQEIANLRHQLDENFEKSIQAILKCSGKVIVSGMGKSGIIGKKIAATLSSTGTPSFFLHPGEAYHGDLGMIEEKDVVLLISNSGETDEVLKLIPFLKHQQNCTISMSGNDDSTLAKNTNYHINIAVEKEACPLLLAPTSSTTATLVMGDAIAVTLMKLRNFKEENFAKFHPGGTLGRRLLTTVGDVMKKNNLPITSSKSTIKEVIQKISEGKLGLVVILENDSIKGVITDGDIRRAMESREKEFFELIASDLMSSDPKLISEDDKLTNASHLMSDHKINSLLVVNASNDFVGVVQVYDLGV